MSDLGDTINQAIQRGQKKSQASDDALQTGYSPRPMPKGNSQTHVDDENDPAVQAHNKAVGNTANQTPKGAFEEDNDKVKARGDTGKIGQVY